MPRIVISYRRSDSAAMAGRIFDRLHAHYGDQSMFMDIDNVPLGTDFRRYIRDAIGQCDLLVAVIGPRWLGPRDTGRPRIHDTTDPVRLEIEGALEKAIPIVPVLVDGAQMPSDEELPDNLKDFAFINAALVDTGRDFRQHVDRLLRGIDDILARAAAPAAPPSPSVPALAPEPAAPSEPEAPPTDTVPQAEPVQAPMQPAPSPAVPLAIDTVRGGEPTPSASPASSHPYWYAAVAGVLFVAVGLVALLARNWSSDPRPAATSTSRIDPAPPREPGNAVDLSANPPIVPGSGSVPNRSSVPPTSQSRPPANAAAPAAAVPPSIRWKLQATLSPKSATSLPLFAKRVAELSRDRMQIDVLPSNATVPTSQVLDAVQSGSLDLAFGPGSLFYGKDRTFALMATVPFGFTPVGQYLFRRRAAPIFDRLLAQQDAVAMPCGSSGRRGELWLKKPLTGTADLVGAKLRIVGLAADIYRELGTAVMVLSAAEIITAFERNVIVGAQYNGPSEDEAWGLPDVAKYFYHPGVVAPTALFDLYVGKNRWEGLGPAGKQIIEQACEATRSAMLADQERADAAALEQFARKKVTVAPLPAGVQRDLYAATRRVLAKFSAENSSFREAMAIVDDMRSSTLAADLR
jgi:TRAP-type mannitol/chloroaromatic compound transport system substrate-binding protein